MDSPSTITLHYVETLRESAREGCYSSLPETCDMMARRSTGSNNACLQPNTFIRDDTWLLSRFERGSGSNAMVVLQPSVLEPVIFGIDWSVRRSSG